jgi:hypothetical protein
LFRRDPFGFSVVSDDEFARRIAEYQEKRRLFAAEAEAQRRQYLDALPTSIPEGQCLAHNRVTPRNKTFRFWLQGSLDGLEPCNCAWVSGLAHSGHFRAVSKARARVATHADFAQLALDDIPDNA